ncbi:CLUMA_CG006194, isoform A [Clunio marinus]|uniref:CLUMA_CG006194, isoform A n=1 Tax=Clunio marinus TaxID=568069 RepID=A0A1J1HX85_9DIPT|nr:CLUMA_CG006194, isoform A [Clunio marinus]
MSFLCVGPRNSGKTMLLNSIQYPGSVNFTTHSVNTVGTNIFTIHNLEKPLKKGSKKNIAIRELGGEMAVMWKKYYSESVEKILFVVDTSNLCQISCAGVLLYSILAEPKLQKAKICLVLTKMDYAYRQMRNEALLMLQIERLKAQVSQEITIIESSAITREGLDQIVEWLFN